jgi:hypothetical protein
MIQRLLLGAILLGAFACQGRAVGHSEWDGGTSPPPPGADAVAPAGDASGQERGAPAWLDLGPLPRTQPRPGVDPKPEPRPVKARAWCELLGGYCGAYLDPCKPGYDWASYGLCNWCKGMICCLPLKTTSCTSLGGYCTTAGCDDHELKLSAGFCGSATGAKHCCLSN